MKENGIGKRIATLRKQKGWTQVDLAEKLSVSDKAVSKWESEAGFPEISQLPVMATLFNVSIDYLMTGKTPEKEIMTISKSELCAKNDDVDMAEKVKDLPKDENGKNIVDYILQYESLKVFKKLCETDLKFITRFSILDAITLSVKSNSLFLLSGKTFEIDYNCRFTFENENTIKELIPLEDKEYFANTKIKSACILPRKFFTMIVTNGNTKEETMNVLLSDQNERKCVWYHAFPYLIDEAYKNGNDKLLLRLLEISRINNAVAYETINPVYDRYDGEYNYVLNYFFIAPKYGNNGHGLVRILESTIKKALEKGDFDMLDEFNKINTDIKDFIKIKLWRVNSDNTKCYIASADEIRIAKLKLDKSVSETELKLQSAIHNGIINIKELQAIKKFDVIKKALYEYPIHPFELIYGMYQQQKWRDLFKFSVDYGIDRLSDSILYRNKKDIEENILKIWAQKELPYVFIKPLCVNDNELYFERSNGSCGGRNQKNLSEIVDYLDIKRCDVPVEDFYKSINGLAYGKYAFILKQFDKNNNLLFETDYIEFSIKEPEVPEFGYINVI